MVAALIMSTTSWNLMIHSDAVYFPLVIPSVGIVASFLTIQFIHIPIERIEARFRFQLFIATLIQSGFCIPILWMLPSEIKMEFMTHHYTANYGRVFGCIMLGLWSGYFISIQTELLTSSQVGVTKKLANACLFDAATNVI
jgi:Na+/H+-translocating membrane pyrophosphatase